MDIDIIGWDIGGAHIKAAALDQSGCVVRVTQRHCPLWKGISRLKQDLKSIAAELNGSSARHAVTMTGELVDQFGDRREGILAILDAIHIGRRRKVLGHHTDGFAFKRNSKS